jgi:hypothetical protein
MKDRYAGNVFITTSHDSDLLRAWRPYVSVFMNQGVCQDNPNEAC